MSSRDRGRPQSLVLPSDKFSVLQRTPESMTAQRWARSTTTLLTASFLLGVSSVAVRAEDASSSQRDAAATNALLLKKLEAMEKRRQPLESELKQKKAQTPATAQAAAPAPAQSGG